MLAWLAQHQVDLVVFEASGGYEESLRLFLLEHQMPCSRLQPARARSFAVGLGLLEKTDALDASLLAKMATLRTHRLELDHGQAQQEFVALLDYRAQLVEQRTRLKTQLQKTTHQWVIASQSRQLEQVEQELAQLHLQLREKVQAQPSWVSHCELLQQVSGVGELVAWSCLAYLPELGQMDRKQIAKLVGLAPLAHQSGKGQHDRGRRCGPGRKKLKRVLWLASLSLVRHDPSFAAFYQRLRAHGKPHAVARIAVCRKLLTTLNALIRDQSTYHPQTAHGDTQEPQDTELKCASL